MNSLDVSTRAETSAQGVLVGTVTSMPAASNYNVGCTVLYMGASGTYDTGCFYTCTQSGAGYTWEKAELVSQDLEVGTGNRALVSDASGRVTASGISTTQLGYLSGVSSDIQAQLNGKVPTGRTINGHALTGDVTLKISDLENDSGFITSTVSNLSNYYTKAQTYMRTEIDSRLDAINSMNVSVVSALPQTGDSHTIYLVPKSASGSDAHQEYLYVNGSWELIGDTSVDLSNYYTKAEVNSRDVSSASWSSNALRIYHTDGTYDSAAPSGAVSTVMTSNLSTSKVVVTNSSGKLAASSTITTTELGYLNGVTSSIQTQLNNKVPTSRTINGHALTGNITLTQSDLGIDIPEISVTANRAVISDSTGALTASAVTSTELGYLDGVRSSIQTQLNGKQATVTGGASSILTSNLTASRALVSDASGKVSVSPVTTTQLGYLSGVTSAIQTQLDGKADAGSEITGGALSVSGSGTDSLQITLTLNNGVEITSNTFSRNRSLKGSFAANFSNSVLQDYYVLSETKYMNYERFRYRNSSNGVNFSYTDITVNGVLCKYDSPPLYPAETSIANVYDYQELTFNGDLMDYVKPYDDLVSSSGFIKIGMAYKGTGSGTIEINGYLQYGDRTARNSADRTYTYRSRSIVALPAIVSIKINNGEITSAHFETTGSEYFVFQRVGEIPGAIAQLLMTNITVT